ncbi:MAG TPA: kelch repeat-containing protein, partial [Bacteroidia bacterium]|nr:kelch repeat-containing protein [Bacteroidia bacterium]
MKIFINSILLFVFTSTQAQQYVWTQKSNLPAIARYEAVGFSIGNKGYLGTGGNFNSGQVLSDFWEYDPLADLWTQKANVPGSARYGAVGFSIHGKGYVGTGWANNGGSALKDFYEYNPISNVWIQKANFLG